MSTPPVYDQPAQTAALAAASSAASASLPAARTAGSYFTLTTSQALGTAAPTALVDSLFTGRVAGGSTVEPGTLGVVAAIFASGGLETGAAGGQAGLGNGAITPYPVASYPGQTGVPVFLQKVDGDDVLMADIIPATLASDRGSRVYGYLSYRSDRGADLKWRLWLYYRRDSDGVEVPATPTAPITGVTVKVPEVVTVAARTVLSGFGVLQTGSMAAELPSVGVTPGTYGSSSLIPVITVDGKGRTTTVTTAAAPPAATLRPTLDILTILAASPQWERHPLAPSVMRLASPTTFPTIADAKANPPTGWSTFTSGSAITSASASAAGLVCVAPAATQSCGFTRSYVQGAPRKRTWIIRLGATLHDAGQACGFFVYSGIAAGIGFDLYATAFTIRTWWGNNASEPVTLNTTKFQAGVWVKMEWDGAGVTIWYNDTNTSTKPGNWTLALASHASAGGGTLAMSADPAAVVSEVFNFQATAASSITGTLMYLESCADDELRTGTKGTEVCAVGYPTTSDAVLVADIDYGVATLPDQAKLRLRAAAAINGMPWDAATVTWSMTGSDTSAAACTAATTYQSAAALTLKQPGSDTTETDPRRYWRLRLIAASASNRQQASFDTTMVVL